MENKIVIPPIIGIVFECIFNSPGLSTRLIFLLMGIPKISKKRHKQKEIGRLIAIGFFLYLFALLNWPWQLIIPVFPDKYWHFYQPI